MKLVIPKQMTVGKRKIQIFQHTHVTHKGEILRGAFEHRGEIHMSRRGNHFAFTQAERHETLWHEVTHAILHEMGRHKLNNDEEFVTEFAQLLSKAIRTAKI